MLTKSSITPYQSLNQIASKYSVFGFLLRNITRSGNHFAARCYLSALDDTSSLPPGQIFSLLSVLDTFYETERNRTERGAPATSEGRGRDGQKRLYVPVTRKVSPETRTFCLF